MHDHGPWRMHRAQSCAPVLQARIRTARNSSRDHRRGFQPLVAVSPLEDVVGPESCCHVRVCVTGTSHGICNRSWGTWQVGVYGEAAHLPAGLLRALLPGPVTVVLKRRPDAPLAAQLNPGIATLGVPAAVKHCSTFTASFPSRVALLQCELCIWNNSQ